MLCFITLDSVSVIGVEYTKMYACTQNHRFSLLLTHTHTRYVCMHGYVCLYAWLFIYGCLLYLTMHAWLCLSKQRDLRRPVLLDPLSAIFTSPIQKHVTPFACFPQANIDNAMDAVTEALESWSQVHWTCLLGRSKSHNNCSLCN